MMKMKMMTKTAEDADDDLDDANNDADDDDDVTRRVLKIMLKMLTITDADDFVDDANDDTDDADSSVNGHASSPGEHLFPSSLADSISIVASLLSLKYQGEGCVENAPPPPPRTDAVNYSLTKRVKGEA